MQDETRQQSKYDSVLSVLYDMCIDAENKPSDRISAAKLLLEYLKENIEQGGEMRVVFDGIEAELAE